MVHRVVGKEEIEIVTTPTDDNRSYRISSAKIERELGVKPKHTVEEAIKDLRDAFAAGKIPNPMDDIRYYNIKTMLAKKLK
jgi:nucleoside-diphosphate-sugar epimerase